MFSVQRPRSAARHGAYASLLLLAFCPSPAFAHDAPKGWSYPFSCCSGFDCREVSAQAISQKSEGYVIKRTGELVSYADKRLKGFTGRRVSLVFGVGRRQYKDDLSVRSAALVLIGQPGNCDRFVAQRYVARIIVQCNIT